MRTFNICIIGYGGFGKFLHHHWQGLEQVRVVAVADEDASKMQHLDSVKTFTNWRELLREAHIDLIAIATIPSTHQEIASACMEAGKNVLIEKPLAINLADAQRIIEARDRHQTIAAIDFIIRFNPLIQALQQLTQQGVFGKLRRVDIENYAQDEQLPLSHWFWHPELSGGILIEHGVHFIDLVHFLAPAKLLNVNGLRHSRNSRQEDQIMANVLYEGGLLATHYHAFARPGFFEATKIKLAYDLADIELHGWIPLWAEVKALVNSKTKQALLSNALFELENAISVEQVADESRPTGWGDTDAVDQSSRHTIRSGGISYEVQEIITGKLHTRQTKEAVYAACVQASLLDVLKKIENLDHKLTAPLEAGLLSLEVAVRATDSARGLL